MSVSVGRPGATFNIGPRGGTVTMGLPGTGLSYQQHIPFGSHSRKSPSPTLPIVDSPPTSPAYRVTAEDQAPIPGEIRSADVATLTSPDLEGLRSLINQASRQKAGLEPLYDEAMRDRLRAWRRLRRREQMPLRLIMKRWIPNARDRFESAEAEAQKVADAIIASHVYIDFALGADVLEKYRQLQEVHRGLSQSRFIWDVTSAVGVDRFRERSAASTNVTRRPIALLPVTDSVIAGDQLGMRFQNANGGDIDIFPGFLVMRSRNSSDFALVDLRNLQLRFAQSTFIEDEVQPSDSAVIGQAWLRSNKDGSRDRRFAANRQIPVMRYGSLHFFTATGISESYLVSNFEAAQAFATAMANLQAAMRLQGNTAPSQVVAGPGPEENQVRSFRRLLPVLPNVAGAHELSALTLALLVVGGAAVYSPSTVAALWAHTETVEALILPSQTTVVPMSTSSPASAATVSNSATPPSQLATPTPLVATTWVTTQTANLRAGPDKSAAVLRVLAAGLRLQEFERRGDWIRVGPTEQAGWVHASLLRR